MLATINSGIVWYVAAYICCASNSSSNTPPRTIASDVFLSIEMVSLPVGGTITRIACGSTISRMIWSRLIPSDCAASVCPSSTEMMPARTISAMYAPSFSPKPRIAATKYVKNVFECR